MADTQNAERLVLVSGATGQQGGAVARSLLDRGFGVRVLTRDPGKPAARVLAERGAELAQGDLDYRESLDRALDGVYGVFSVQQFFEAGYDGEVRQGRALADAAKEAGVKHFVYSSVGSAYRSTGLPHFESKWEIEEHVRSMGLPYTILRPVAFMQNWEMMREQILSGTLAQALDPERPLQQVAVEDVGVFAAMAFENPQKWVSRELDIAGDELTMLQTAEIFSRVTGRGVSYYQVPWDDFREFVGEEITRMQRWFNEEGYEADIAALRKEYPDLTTFEQYLRDHGWDGAKPAAESESTKDGSG